MNASKRGRGDEIWLVTCTKCGHRQRVAIASALWICSQCRHMNV